MLRLGRILLGLAAPWLLAACSSDLFHDTGWPTLCEREPSVCAEPEQDAGTDGPPEAAPDSLGEDADAASADALPDVAGQGADAAPDAG